MRYAAVRVPKCRALPGLTDTRSDTQPFLGKASCRCTGRALRSRHAPQRGEPCVMVLAESEQLCPHPGHFCSSLLTLTCPQLNAANQCLTSHHDVLPLRLQVHSARGQAYRVSTARRATVAL
jgi:hypothetical protein